MLAVGCEAVQVLAADVTFGYHCQFGRLTSVNGIPILNIYQLANVCDTCSSEFVIFELQPRTLLSATPSLACKHISCIAV
jgi:hypothetical protein